MNIQAPLCDIKRFAVHDGPGIRTTLFVKGCPLRCVWCHNPESMEVRGEIGVQASRCAGCGACAAVCDVHTVKDGQHTLDRARCTGCGRCVEACLYGALTWYGRPLTVEDAMKNILEDRLFYDHSGGGATLSGGEPLLHDDWSAAVLAGVKKEKIHTAVDTCGDVPWEAFEKTLPVTDIFLYDLKHADPDAHRRLTGRDNRRLLDNLRRLAATGAAIEIRMPLVPGANDDDAALKGAAEILAPLKGITAVRLLPYHAMARGKYEAIGHADTLPDAPPPSPERLARAAGLLAAAGLPVLPPDA